jgi:hypothetical protein
LQSKRIAPYETGQPFNDLDLERLIPIPFPVRLSARLSAFFIRLGVRS